MFAPALTTSTICRLVHSGRVAVCDDDLGVSRTPVYALAQDPHGYLWIGTENGPVLFDGLAWSTPAPLAPLAAMDIRAFAQAPGRRLWIATDGAGVACVDVTAPPYQVVAWLGVANGLPSPRVHAVWSDPDDPRDHLWAGTHEGLVLLVGDRVARVITESDGLPLATVWSLHGDRDGRLWVGTKAGLAVLVDGVVRPDLVAADDPVRASGVHAVSRDERGRVWVALVGGALLWADTREDGPWSFQPAHDCHARVRALWPEGGERLWVATSAGVTLLEGDTPTPRDRWTVDSGLPAKEARALCGDHEGRMWVGTMTGLALLEDRAALLRMPLHPGTLVFAFAADEQGRVWVGADEGVVALDAVTHDPVALPPLPPALARDAVYALLSDGHGGMWVGAERDGLFHVDARTGDIRTHITEAGHVPILCREGRRRVWAGLTGVGLVCVDSATGAVVRRIGVREGLPQENVQALQMDAQGRLWAGTHSGWLACIETERGVVLTTIPLGQGRDVAPIITDMDRDAAGMLWVSTHGGGLVQVDPARGVVVRALTTRDDFPTDLLYSCRADRDGHIWAGTRRGVIRYTPATGRCIALGRSLGLPSEECNSHALYLDAHARVWVGTVQGVGIIEADRISADIVPCTAHLTGLIVMGRERALCPDLELEDSDYDLIFSYGAVTFTAAPQVVYRARLVGLEEGWSAPTPQRSARYTNLRPGAYTFRVAARNWGGEWSEAAEVSFRVVRDRRAREIEEALERERIDKEVALATAALFERLALRDGLTGLLNRRALDERLAQDIERTHRHGHPLAVALADIDHFKRINDIHGHLIGDEVLKAAARLCHAAGRDGDSVGRYGGEEIALVLPETTVAEAATLCERLCHAIEGHDWDSLARGLRVTVSIGVAGGRGAAPPALLLADADDALYRAKRGGRNRVCRAVGRDGEGADPRWADRLDPARRPAAPEAVDEGDEADPAARAPVADLVDSLTGLGTRRSFRESLRQAVAHARQQREAVTLVRFHVDVEEGAAPGGQRDQSDGAAAWTSLAGVLRRGRANDRAFQLERDEFALLLPRTSLDGARQVVERVRGAITRDLPGIAVSVGLAALTVEDRDADNADDADTLHEHAEIALDAAKESGRTVT